MQVVILCGGRGTRLADVSNDAIAKPMVPIGNHPILWHIMKYYSHFGYSDFILCLGYRSDSIKEYFLNFHAMSNDITVDLGADPKVEIHRRDGAPDWRVTLAETGLHTMTAGRVKRVADYVTGDHFMLTYGDGIGTVDLRRLEAFHLDNDRLVTLTGVVPPGRFGELYFEGHYVTQIDEKPQQSVGRYINGGFMVLNRKFIEGYLDDDPDSVMLERSPFERAASDGQMVMWKHDGFWHAMDTRRDWVALNDLWDSGEAPWRVW